MENKENIQMKFYVRKRKAADREEDGQLPIKQLWSTALP